jgi:hypothetical protein
MISAKTARRLTQSSNKKKYDPVEEKLIEAIRNKKYKCILGSLGTNEQKKLIQLGYKVTPHYKRVSAGCHFVDDILSHYVVSWEETNEI